MAGNVKIHIHLRVTKGVPVSEYYFLLFTTPRCLYCLVKFCIFSGKCFVDIAEEMKEVYAVYCRNHDDAISLMEKVHVRLHILF